MSEVLEVARWKSDEIGELAKALCVFQSEFVGVKKESTANTIKVIGGIKEQLDEIIPRLDKYTKLTITFNQAEFITESIDTVPCN